MKAFFKKTCTFLSLFIFFVVVLPFVIVRNYSNFKINPEKTIIVVGHSHSACAYNDAILDSVLNISANAEGYIYNYLKIKKIIEQNKQIRTVLIEFSNNSVDINADRNTQDKEKPLLKFPVYAPFMDLNDFKFIIQNYPNAFLNKLSNCFKNNLKVLFDGLDYSSKVGGFKSYPHSKVNFLLSDSNNINHTLFSEQEIAKLNLSYLDSLINLCKKEYVTPVLIRSPLHEKYPGYNNEELFKKLLDDNYRNLKFIDFSKYPVQDSELFDLSHLNINGSTSFSSWLNKMLKKGLLNSKNPQLIINKEFKKIRLNSNS